MGKDYNQDILQFWRTTTNTFTAKALAVFQRQYNFNPVYNQYCNLLNIQATQVKTLQDIPFLPISFFKTHPVITAKDPVQAEAIFTSSSTTGQNPSYHHVLSLKAYETSFIKGFTRQYGPAKNWVILALLPSYLERKGSAVVYMIQHLVAQAQPPSGFYLNNIQALTKTLHALEAKKQPTILLGVSYALLDLVESDTFNLNHTIIMETGGMKGTRAEWTKHALHHRLKKGFGVTQIHSEYGMTELLSQAYAKQDGVFECPPWMRVFTRDTEDPLTLINGHSGGLNVIDLANYNACSFIATDDLAHLNPNGSFELLGRLDHSDIRGCNLLVV